MKHYGLRLLFGLAFIGLALGSGAPASAETGSLHHNLGAGYGIPFGMLGLNYEFEVDLGNALSVGPTIAVGHTIIAGAAMNVGLQTHLASKEASWRPGVEVWYGTNTIVEYYGAFSDIFTEAGITLGGNLRYRSFPSSKSAWDLHVLYVLTPDYGSAEDYGSAIKLALGYIHRF